MIELEFEGELVRHGSWHFIYLPDDLSADMRSWGGIAKGGWGSIKVDVTIGASSWSTSVFPSKQRAAYLLPVKAPVRKTEGIAEGDEVLVTLRL